MTTRTHFPVQGLGTALVTPFRHDLTIDEPALRRLVDYQIEGGVDFLVSGGTTGESATLSDPELLRVAELVVDAARGRVPVVAGAGGNNTHHVIELAQEYQWRGVAGLLTVTPYYNKPTQEGLESHYRAVAEATRLPVLLYNVPSRTSVNLLPETVARLAEIPNIVGIKEASGDVAQIADILNRVPPHFKIFAGDDALTLPVIALGGVGVISVVSNEVPRLTADFVTACLEGRWQAARGLSRLLFPLMKANFWETSPGPVKAVLAELGLLEEVLRLPLVPVRRETREKLRAILQQLGLLPGAAVRLTA